MSPARRVVIIGVASHWGAELARRLERDPAVEYLAGIDTVPPRSSSSAPTSSRPTSAARCCRGCSRDRGRHRGPLRDPLVPGAGQAGAGPARRQRDRDAAAAGRLRADREPASGRGPRLGGDLRLRGSLAGLLHRGDGARGCRFEPASSATSPSSRGTSTTSPAATRELVCCMLRYQPEIGAGPRHAAGPLPEPAGGPDPARLRSPPAAPARRRRDRGARGRRPQPGARGGQRRPVGIDLAEPHAAPRPPRRRCRSRTRSSARPWSGSAAGSVPARSTATACACCGSGAAWTTGACAARSATSPDSTPVAAVRDFAAKSAGRRVGAVAAPGRAGRQAREGR